MSTAVKADIDRAIAFVRSTTAGSPRREAVDELLATLMRAKARIEQLEGAVHTGAANLRDQFAGNALAGILAGPDNGFWSVEKAASTSFKYADAMLRARAAEGGDL